MEHRPFGTGKEAATSSRARHWLPGTVLLVLLAACSRPADEARLRETIGAMEAAIESRSLSGVLDHVAEDFGGSHGLDRDGLRRILQVQIATNARIGAVLGPLQVEMQGERATVGFSVLFTGSSGRFIPERGRAYEVVTGWRVEGGEWKVFYADWNGETRR